MEKNYSGWHVLYVKSQHEKKIDSILKDLEIESFLPTLTTLRQWSDRRKKVILPLFPSYVFVNVHSKKEFYKALNLEGVFKYVRFGESFAKVRDEEISRIKSFLNLGGISQINTCTNVPVVGDIMTIVCGPLDGLKCEVIKINNKNKVIVRIESLRKNITAYVPNSTLKPIMRNSD